MFNHANILAGLIGALILFGSIFNAYCATQSDDSYFLLEVWFGLPLAGLLLALSIRANTAALKRGTMKGRWAACYYVGLLVLGYSAYHITWRYLVPSDVRFVFTYPGNTDTFQCVQFYFKENGRWLAGPSVQDWPMEVRFPDLNSDGHYDIQVTDIHHGGMVEFVYLKQNDGHVFWHLTKNTSHLSPGYPPAGLFSGP